MSSYSFNQYTQSEFSNNRQRSQMTLFTSKQLLTIIDTIAQSVSQSFQSVYFNRYNQNTS